MVRYKKSNNLIFLYGWHGTSIVVLALISKLLIILYEGIDVKRILLFRGITVLSVSVIKACDIMIKDYHTVQCVIIGGTV